MASSSQTKAGLMCSCTSLPFSARGWQGLDEGQKISYEIVQDKRTGKNTADQLAAL
jgi:hypothetical protein